MDPLGLVPQHIRQLTRRTKEKPPSNTSCSSSLNRRTPQPLPRTVAEEFAFVAIIDISGYSKLSSYLQEVLGADSGAKIKELLNKPINVIIKHVHLSGGSIVKFAGDAVIAMWSVESAEKSAREVMARRVFLGCLQLIAYFQNYELVIPEKAIRSQGGTPSVSMRSNGSRRESSILEPEKRRSSYVTEALEKQPKKTLPLKIHIGLGAGSLQHIHIGDLVSVGTHEENSSRSEYFIAGKALKSSGILLGLGKPGDFTFDTIGHDLVIEAMAQEPSFPPVRKGSRELNGRFFMVADTDPIEKYVACITQSLGPNVAFTGESEGRLFLPSERDPQFIATILPYVDDALAQCMRQINTYSVTEDLDGESPFSVDLGNYDQLRGVAVLFLYFPAFNVETVSQPENLSILQKIIQIIIAATRRHQGCLRQFNCDDKSLTALLVWGLEGFAHEKSECYFSMAAAMDIASQLKPVIGPEFAIGATKGTVFAGIVGNSSRSDGTLLGVCVNNAARLMCLDRCRGGILCDEDTYKDTEDEFEYDTGIPEATLKGVPNPVKIYAPLQTNTGEQRLKVVRSSIEGRSSEISEIQEVITSWQNDGKKRLLISGRSGTGKSALAHLAEDKIRALPSTLLCFGKCQENHQNTMLSTYTFIVNELLAAMASRGIRHKDLSAALQQDLELSRPSLCDPATGNRIKKDVALQGDSCRDTDTTNSASRSILRLPTVGTGSKEDSKKVGSLNRGHRKSSPNTALALKIEEFDLNKLAPSSSIKHDEPRRSDTRGKSGGTAVQLNSSDSADCEKSTPIMKKGSIRRGHRPGINIAPRSTEAKLDKLLSAASSLALLSPDLNTVDLQLSSLSTPVSGLSRTVSKKVLDPSCSRKNIPQDVPEVPTTLPEVPASETIWKLFSGPDCDTLNAIPGLNASSNTATVTHDILPRLAAIIIRIFGALASLGYKIAIMIDDLQWSDNFSLELTHTLMQKCPQVLFISIMRPMEECKEQRVPLLSKIKKHHITNDFELKNLEKEAVEAMIKKLVTSKPESVDQLLTEEIFHRSQGNPLVAEVLIRILNDDTNVNMIDGVLTRTGDSDSANLPTGATAAVVAQLDRLKPQMKTILKYASISGMFFNLQELNDILLIADESLGYDKTVAGLENVIVLYDVFQFVKETENKNIFCFSHYLIQQGILSTMVPSKREEIHSVYANYFLKRMKRASNKWDVIQSIVHHLFQIPGMEERKQITLYTAFLESAEMGMVTEAFEFYEALQNFEKKIVLTKNVYEAIREQRLLAYIHFSKLDTHESLKHCIKALDLSGFQRPTSKLGIMLNFATLFQTTKQIVNCTSEMKQMQISDAFAKRLLPKAFPKSPTRKYSRDMTRNSLRASFVPARPSTPTSGQNLKTISELVKTFQLMQQMLAPSLELVNMQCISLILGVSLVNEHAIQVASYFAECATALDLVGRTVMSSLTDKRCEALISGLKNERVENDTFSIATETALASIYKSRGIYRWRNGDWENAGELLRASERALNKLGKGFSENCYFCRSISDFLYRMCGRLSALELQLEDDRKFHLEDVNEDLNGEYLFREAAFSAEIGRLEEAADFYSQAANNYSVHEEEPLRTMAVMLNALRVSVAIMQSTAGQETSDDLTNRILLHLETFSEAVNVTAPLEIPLTAGMSFTLMLILMELHVITTDKKAHPSITPKACKLALLISKKHTSSISKNVLTDISGFIKHMALAVRGLWAGANDAATVNRFTAAMDKCLRIAQNKIWLTSHQEYMLSSRIWCITRNAGVGVDAERMNEVKSIAVQFEGSGHALEYRFLKMRL
ncbi:hypothetical protein HDU77_006491 [Chytriomyces hyalinus]|nr:hypothetical protein HDU77_006491 [Chytriomyces hyalinus]